MLKLFNCMESVKVEVETVSSECDVSNSSSSVASLTLQNLPWEQEARFDDEDYVKKFVINKSDQSWYRPRPVLLKKNSICLIKKYLQDVRTYKQYGVGEVEDTFDPEWPGTLYQSRLDWLYNVFCHTWTQRLKVFKPFVLEYDTILQEVRPISSGVKDIARLLRAVKSDKNAMLKESGQLVDATFDNGTVDNYSSGVELSLSFKLLYQAHVDVLHLHGQNENCYIHLMRLGDEQEKVVDITRNRERGGQSEKRRDKNKKVKMPLNYWDQLQKNKMKQKEKEKNMKQTLPGYMNHGDKTADEITHKLGKIEKDRHITDEEIKNTTESDDSSATYITERLTEISDSSETQPKRKRRGLMRRLSAPLRWIKKKF